MDEYISRSAALKAVGESSWAGFRLNEIPAADVVPVVRCRECIYWEPASPTRTSGNCNRSFDIPAWANDFCSYGKRKNGGQDDV